MNYMKYIHVRLPVLTQLPTLTQLPPSMHPPPDLPSLSEQLDTVPEERLVFALADGRGGVLAVRGKRIIDTRPTRPTWGFLSGPECVATAITGWGPYVFLGDAEGTLMRWDISSGKLCALLVGGQGAVKQLHCAPLPANALAAMPSAGMQPQNIGTSSIFAVSRPLVLSL